MRTVLKACTEKEWHQLFADALTIVFYNPAVAKAVEVLAELKLLGIFCKLDGSEDALISIYVTASRIITTNLHNLAKARLQALARLSRVEELAKSARYARVWQANEELKRERKEKVKTKAVRKAKKLKVDEARLEAQYSAGLGPRHPESDSSELEDRSM